MNQHSSEKDLQSRITKLEEDLQSLRTNLDKKIIPRINGLEEDVNAFSSRDLNINTLKETIKQVEDKIKLLEDSKIHIFSILALFFGIFTFIAIDVGATKSLLSYVDKESVSILILAIIGIIIVQGLFCTFIYCFLLKPFLTKTCSQHKKCNTWSIITIIIILYYF